MDSAMKEFEHLVIKLEEVKSATDNFNDTKIIGKGGFGNVYEGKVSQPGGKTKAAFKRLDRKHGQGDPQFWKEVMMLSRYTHENLISLLGYCNEGGEMILMYEHASNGSLDRHLSSTTLTWTQRIRICHDAAKGLCYLHEDKGNHHRVLHRDIKSSNILLDENWKAKISDMGLAKVGPASQFTFLITDIVGTFGYIDPMYLRMGFLTKESDVYSFGVVLFEVLCGRVCFDYSNAHSRGNIVHIWKQRYKENKLDEIVFKDDLVQALDQSSLEMFSKIAFQCLQESREKRPKMSDVVEKLEIALKFQEPVDLIPKEHQEIVKAVVPPLIYGSVEELKVLLSKGVILNGGKTWVSINDKGEHIERIYIEACLNPHYRLRLPAEIEDDSLTIVNSRFPGGQCYYYWKDFEARVRGQYLTPQILYTLNLVFRYRWEDQVNSYSRLKYRIDGEDDTKVFIIYPCTHMREDGWFIVPLYHFTSQHKTADLQFQFEERSTDLLVAGIEFQPSEEKVQLQVFEEYQDIVKAASQSLVYKSLQELKQILSKGIHLKDYKTWFSLDEKGQHCHMISMEDCLIPNEDSTPQTYESHEKSRFPAGFYETKNKGFKTHVKTQFLSPSVTYTVNLVYNSSSIGRYIDLKYRLRGEVTTSVVYIANRRQDDWLYMAELYQFTSDGSIVDLEIIFENIGTGIDEVEGIMFEPLEIVEDQVSKDDKVENIQTISDSESDTYWEQKFPNDYEEILNLSKDSLMWTTKKELYSILRRGFLINNGQEWFTVDKHGKKCPMLSARATWVIYDKLSACGSSHESRFREVLVITGYKFKIQGVIKSKLVSPETTYAAYLVFKLPHDQSTFFFPRKGEHILINQNLHAHPLYNYHSTFEAPIQVSNYSFIYLGSPPHTPVIGPKLDENTYNPLNRYKGIAIPQQRTDGWMEVKVWEFQTTTEDVPMHLSFEHPGEKDLSGLIVQGIELRPI